jgi:hypothetical protein
MKKNTRTLTKTHLKMGIIKIKRASALAMPSLLLISNSEQGIMKFNLRIKANHKVAPRRHRGSQRMVIGKRLSVIGITVH